MTARFVQRILLLGAGCAAIVAPTAAADPGAVDRAFDGDGRVTQGLGFGVVDVTVVGGRLAVSSRAYRRGIAFFGATGRPAHVMRRASGSPPEAVLPDGRYVTLGSRAGGNVVTRRLPSGAVDRSFGRGGQIRLPDGSGIAAVTAEGRIVTTLERTAGTMLERYRADGTFDPAFGTRTLPPGFSLVRTDTAGRLVAVTKPPDGFGRVVRLTPEGAEDPAFATSAIDFVPRRLVVSSTGSRVLILSYEFFRPRSRLLDGAGRALPLPAGVARALDASQAAAFDRQDRLVVFDGRRLQRVSADGQRVELLRARLPGGRYGLRATALAIDRRARIVLGGYVLLDRRTDPADAAIRDDTAQTRGFLLRLEGGDRRLAILSRRRGPSIAVRCLPTAAGGFVGTLTLDAPGRRAVRRVLSLRAGETRRFAVPSALRRGGRPVTVEARGFDGTTELISARRTLRR